MTLVLAFFEPMRRLADRGGGTLHLGTFAKSAKLLRGAQLLLTRHLVRARASLATPGGSPA